MSDFTPRANLRLPGGGSTGIILPDEQVDIDVLNDNFRKIDALLGARNVPSASSYSGSMDGDIIYARDTKLLSIYDANNAGLVDPRVAGGTRFKGTQAQMNAFTGAEAGDSFFNTTDNIEYIRLGGSWVSRVLGYVSIDTPDQMGITGTATALTGVSISFTLAAPARVKITGQLRGNGSATTTVVEHGLRDNGSQVLAWTRGANSGNTAAMTSSQAVSGVLDLASGSHTFTVTSRVVAGGGTYNSRPLAAEPIYLLIELVA